MRNTVINLIEMVMLIQVFATNQSREPITKDKDGKPLPGECGFVKMLGKKQPGQREFHPMKTMMLGIKRNVLDEWVVTKKILGYILLNNGEEMEGNRIEVSFLKTNKGEAQYTPRSGNNFYCVIFLPDSRLEIWQAGLVAQNMKLYMRLQCVNASIAMFAGNDIVLGPAEWQYGYDMGEKFWSGNQATLKKIKEWIAGQTKFIPMKFCDYQPPIWQEAVLDSYDILRDDVTVVMQMIWWNDVLNMGVGKVLTGAYKGKLTKVYYKNIVNMPGYRSLEPGIKVLAKGTPRRAPIEQIGDDMFEAFGVMDLTQSNTAPLTHKIKIRNLLEKFSK